MEAVNYVTYEKIYRFPGIGTKKKKRLLNYKKKEDCLTTKRLLNYKKECWFNRVT